MKKCLLLIIMLLPSLEMMAQSLVGSWEESWKEKGNNKEMSSLAFKQNGIMSLHIFSEKKENDGNLTSMTISIPGTYTRAGQLVYIKFDTNKLTVDYDDKKMNEGKYSKEERAAAIIVIEQYRRNLSVFWPQTSTMKIISITAKDLVVDLIDEERRYKRVANH